MLKEAQLHVHLYVLNHVLILHHREVKVIQNQQLSQVEVIVRLQEAFQVEV